MILAFDAKVTVNDREDGDRQVSITEISFSEVNESE
jgi:hypothetical protein